MKMRKKILTALIALCLAAGAGGIAMQNVTAKAAAAESGTSLFLPASYEQYLPLVNPSDAAVNDSYIAVADGNKLYIYDRSAKSYSCYLHTKNNGDTRNISKLQFSDDGRLFFSDQDAQLYIFDAAAKTARIQSDIPCATFIIDGDTLYTAAVTTSGTTLYAIPHRDASLSFARAVTVGTTSSSVTPCMFYADGTLYCAVNYDVQGFTARGSGYEHSVLQLAGNKPVTMLTSVAVFNGEIYYTVSGALSEDGLYRTVLGESSEQILSGSGFKSLSPSGESLYCVKNATVREVKKVNDKLAYTGYEVASSSDSQNRIAHATDTARARDLLVTADSGNRRVSVFNTKTNQFTVLNWGTPSCVATDGEIIAAGVGNSVYVYRYGDAEDSYKRYTTENAVTGVAVVYGRCYYITEHHYGLAEDGARGEFTRSNVPAALTSDIYGYLYVADQSGVVTRYTEEEYLDFTQSGEVVSDSWRLPTDFKSLRADYEGGIYYLSGRELYKNGAVLGSFDTRGYVYRGDGAASLDPVSIALSYEDNGLYVQYGDFMLFNNQLIFPTLSSISATDGSGNRLYHEIFSAPETKDIKLVDVQPEATAVFVELGNMTERSDTFSYASYSRVAGGRGVLLAQTAKYSLVALYGDYSYSIALYRSEDCAYAPVSTSDVPDAFRYTSNEVAFSYYPCLEESLTIKRLPRGTVVILLETVTAESGYGFDFAYVDVDGVRGYIPLGYLAVNSPISPAPEEYTLGYLKATSEGVVFYRVDDRSQTITVTDRMQVKIKPAAVDGYFDVYFTHTNGAVYTAQVRADSLESGNPTALRTSVIIILSVIAVGVIAAYVLFVPRKKKD